MTYQGSPEPIDFDFFDDGPSTKRSSRLDRPDPKPNRPLSGKRSGSARGCDGDDRESVRSVASSRSSVSVRIPTATPTHDDGNEADYYSDDFDDSDREGQKSKNGNDTFRLKDDIDALKQEKRRERGSARNGKATSKTSITSKTKSKTGSGSGTKSRPKTSIGRRRRSDSSSSNASTESSRSSSSFTSESSRSHRDNDSVTDVSPLPSAPSSPIPKLEYDEQEMERETDRMRSVHFEEDHADSYRDSNERRAKSRPKSSKAKDGRKVTKTPGYSQYNEDPRLRETEAKELSMLLRAVLELDETPNESDLSALHKNLKRPISGKRKNRPQSAPMPHQRMNMSFSNDEVKRIDKDNQRLLGKIVGKSSEPCTTSGRTSRPSSAKRTTFTTEKPVSHSAVKRQRDQRRIEIENMQILKRIEAARAAPEVEKAELLKDYHQQMQYATQVSKTPGGPRSRPASAKQPGKGYNNSGMNRASSMSSLGTDFSADTFTSSNTSHSRPRSSKWSGYQAGRPAWDDRFYLDD